MKYSGFTYHCADPNTLIGDQLSKYVLHRVHHAEKRIAGLIRDMESLPNSLPTGSGISAQDVQHMIFEALNVHRDIQHNG